MRWGDRVDTGCFRVRVKGGSIGEAQLVAFRYRCDGYGGGNADS